MKMIIVMISICLIAYLPLLISFLIHLFDIFVFLLIHLILSRNSYYNYNYIYFYHIKNPYNENDTKNIYQFYNTPYNIFN